MEPQGRQAVFRRMPRSISKSNYIKCVSRGGEVPRECDIYPCDSGRAATQIDEIFYLFGDRDFRRQTFHRARAVKAVHVWQLIQYVLSVLRHGDRTSMTEHQHIAANRARGLGDARNPWDACLQREAGLGSDRSMGR